MTALFFYLKVMEMATYIIRISKMEGGKVPAH
jgi:hypothetical protein